MAEVWKIACSDVEGLNEDARESDDMQMLHNIDIHVCNVFDGNTCSNIIRCYATGIYVC